jgi:hypothetical protein
MERSKCVPTDSYAATIVQLGAPDVEMTRDVLREKLESLAPSLLVGSTKTTFVPTGSDVCTTALDYKTETSATVARVQIGIDPINGWGAKSPPGIHYNDEVRGVPASIGFIFAKANNARSYYMARVDMTIGQDNPNYDKVPVPERGGDRLVGAIVYGLHSTATSPKEPIEVRLGYCQGLQ